ncbi:MAG: cytochrome c3 family protein [Syntrophales bacterium]
MVFIVLIGLCTFCFLYRKTGNSWSGEYSAENVIKRPILISDTDIFKGLADPSNREGSNVKTKHRTINEIADVSKPERDQPGKVLISIEGARMKGVFFDHSSHESYTHSCLTCHHKTLSSCKTCHPLKRSAKGNKVTLANVYHKVSSGRSCGGCHESKKSEPNCAGCHYLIKGAPMNASCRVCHSGLSRKDKAVLRLKTLDKSLLKKVPKVVDIGFLKKEYMPVRFSHLAHVRKLSGISDKSKLADYFHVNQNTICAGCHHYPPIESKNPLPLCRDCHDSSVDLQNLNKTGLTAAYHLQCINCHNKMGLKPLKCTDCHAENLKNKTSTRKNQAIQ